MAQRPALGEFLQWESQSWVEAVSNLVSDEKEYFMPLEILKAYFTADDSKKLNQILIEIFDTNFPPIDPELILRDHTAIFCILLRIGQGVSIEHFARYEELSDRRLPFDPSNPPEEFPEEPNDPRFLQRFCERQRMYCVPIFDCHMLHKHFARTRLLPILSKESLGQEGMASKYVIKIYGPHNKLLPAAKNAIPNDTPNSNTFILKSYSTRENERYYTQEVNGFRAVKNTESIVKFYGSYIHGNDFNILLEYADKGCLEDYFKNETPPSRGVDIIKFWESLFQLVKGLKSIHSTREGHHNVTTQSILVLSNGVGPQSSCQFKFADFGLHPTKTETTPNAEAATHFTYNPPECYLPFSDDQTRRNSSKLTWAADIWSLGCIYSEAAIWIADGYKGLEDYRHQRVEETDRILFKGGDCFHDGERVLQSVLTAHGELEDRLRRTDYITKEVLDSMVDEMLWEEDRPNAKALWRKAEMITSRARQKLSANSGEEFPRPPGSAGRSLPPRREPPTQPLPPIPRLSSIAERQYPPNVEKWRAQIATSNPSSQPRLNRQSTAAASTATSESVPDLDREINGSISSWQMGDNSSVASPITPFTSPHASVYNDYAGRTPMEMRANSIRSQNTFQSSNPSRVHPRILSFLGSQAPSDYGSIAPSIAPSIPQSVAPSVAPSVTPSASLSQREVGERTYTYSLQNTNMVLKESQRSTPTPTVTEGGFSKALDDATASLSRTVSRAGSRQSVYSASKSHHSDETAYHSQVDDAPQKSHKRMGGFSLFPIKTRHEATPSPETIRGRTKTPSHHDDTVPRSVRAQSFSTSSGLGSWAPEPGPPDYLSLNTCLEWKKAHKTKKGAKKNAKVPPLPGASMLEGIKDRDHVFIIDDSASMAPVWADVKRVFEALSYVVKGMSPDGTELFFTISFETWRRKDTFDLCTYLEKKKTNGQTNIAWRLNLQLELYRAKIWGAHSSKKPLRPMSIYILTNGEWGKGADPKVTIKQTADLLMQHDMLNGQVTVEFISFADTAAGMQHINDITNTDFGIDIVDSERWTGNVLKMLKGPIDKNIWESGSPDEPELSSPKMEKELIFAQQRLPSIVNELA